MARRVTARALAIVVALGGSAACHTDHLTAPQVAVASTITVDLPTNAILVGDSVRAADTVRDANGIVIDSALVKWSSTQATVASVNSFGVVHGVATGAAKIVARAGNAADTVLVTVDTKAAIKVDSVRPVQLVAGQAATLYGHQFSVVPAANLITVGGSTATTTASDSTHIQFVLPDTDCAPAGTRAITLHARGSISAVRAAVAPNGAPVTLPVGSAATLTGASGCLQFAASAATARYIAIVSFVTSTPDVALGFTLTAVSGDSAPLGWNGFARVRHAAAPRHIMRASPSVASVRRSTVRAAAASGDAVHINVPIGGCDSAVATTGHVMAISTHAIVAQDDSAAGGGFAAADFTSIGAEFDQFIYPTDTLHFGSPSDVDGNGHVIIYFTPQVNHLTIGEPAIVGGFVSYGDLQGKSVCKTSNGAEIIYVVAPDASHAAATVRQTARTALAHELQHLINAGNRIFKSHASSFEETWLDEGLSHSAEDFVGRAEDGFTDGQQLNYAAITATGADFQAFYQPNTQRFASWLATPYVVGAADTVADSSQAARGATWALLRYTYDQYAGGMPAAVTRALALGPATGIYNLTTAVGVPFDSLMAGWLVANFASGQLAGVAPRYTYTSYDMFDVESKLSGAFPLGLQTFPIGSVSDSLGVQANAGFYIDLNNAGPVPAYSVRIVPSLTAGARIYLLRAQ